MFLAKLATIGDCPAAYRGGYTTPEQVAALREQSGYFDAAFRIIMREREALPVKPAPMAPVPVSEADFCAHVTTGHAKEIVLHADISTLLLLCKRLADAVGIAGVEGLPVIDWFNRERRGQLEREILAIGDTDPEFAEHLQRELGRLRGLAGDNSIVEPLDG